MNTLYCQQCGAKNEYNSIAPTFCGKCGNNMKKLVSADPNEGTVPSSRPKRGSRPEAEDEGASRAIRSVRDRRRAKQNASAGGDEGFVDDVNIDIESLNLGTCSVQLDSPQSESFSLDIPKPEPASKDGE